MAKVNTDALVAAITEAVGLDDSAVAVITGVSAAIAAAVAKQLADDTAVSDASAAAVQQVIDDTTAQLVAGNQKIGAAIAANPGGTTGGTPPVA